MLLPLEPVTRTHAKYIKTTTKYLKILFSRQEYQLWKGRVSADSTNQSMSRKWTWHAVY
jgi:hypothetical protein